MNAETGTYTETPWFGHFQHENVTPLLKLSDFMVVSPEDDFRVGQPSHFYAYIADTFEDAVSGDPAHGSLYVWAALDPTKTNLVKGETVPGHFVPLTQAENANDNTLKAAAIAKGAFRFARLEDATVAYQTSSRVYFADTGKAGENTLRGRIYQLDIDPSDPTSASLTLLLDGDTGDDMANPDNLGTSPQSLMIQEDRENPFRGVHSRILRYDFNDQSLTPVARVNTPPPLAPGSWESSGIIWAGNLLGDHWWLTDVQAHGTFRPQPGPTLVPNSSSGENGQLQALFVPKS
jgi:secreted PhoX family phosphatase